MQVGRSELAQLKNLLARLADLDIFLRLEGEALRFSAPKGALTPALRDEITQVKPGLMAYLASLEGGQGGQEIPAATPANPAHPAHPASADHSSPPAHPPLSFGQQRLWFLDSLAREPEGDSQATMAARTAYLLTAALRLTGHLDLAALTRAVAALARRHPVLRTVVSTQGETPWQAVREDITPPVLTSPRPAGMSLTDHLMALAGEPVDLAEESPLRVHHVPEGEGENVLLIVVHHIAADGWSLGILVAELSHFYRAELHPETPGGTLPALPCQYTDYARWQRERLTGARLEGLLSQWKEALDGVPTEVELPLDRPRPSVQTMAGGHLHFTVPAATYAALSQGARAQGATPFMALLAAYGWLLSRWLGESRFLIGTPVANRLESRFEPLIGFFVNTLPLVFSSQEGETFGALLNRVTTEAAGAFSRQELPFDLLVDRLGLKRDLARAPLVQHAFVLLNAPTGRLELPGLTWESLGLDAPTAKYDLSLTLEPQADGSLAADLEYNADCFLPEPMAWFARQLQNLLAGLAARATGAEDLAAVVLRPTLLWDTPWREQVLQDWSQARQPLPPASPDLFQRFLEQATAHPDAIALVAAEDGSTRSYRDLASQARQVAVALAGQGLGPGDLALLLCPRGLAFAEGLLGCLAGAVGYVPVAADTPPARLQRLAADAGVKAVLTVSGFDPGVPLRNRAGELLPRIDLDRLPAATEGDLPLTGLPWAGDIPAYVIFTSGSTGRPKGVVVGREALSRHLPVMAERYELAPGDRFMLVSAYGFDLAQEQLLTPLIRGATVVVQGDDDGQPGWQPEAVLASVIRHRVNVLNLPASIWAALVADWQQRPAGALQGVALRLMVVGAEPFAAGALPAWRKLPIPANRVVNCYGPTEIVITATLYEVPEVLPPGRVLLGPPLPGREVYVVDDQGEPLPPGLPGELVLTEPCLAMGYLNLPEETAQAFVPDPLRPGRRRYRTGDRVRWVCREGQGGVVQPMLDFLGRRDAQLKLRGLRIESGEVEAALLALPALHGVSAAAVAIRPVGGQPQLVAYLETGTPLPEAGTLRQQLAEVLPDAWLPARFEALNPLPRTDSGKVDRRALPAPAATDADLADPAGRPPATPLESRLAELFAGVLGRARVAADANFFELGGDSIVAIQVVARARAVGLPLSARMIFRHQTVAALASHLAELEQAAPQPGDPAARACPALVEAFGLAPLSPIQADFLALGSPAPGHFNQTVLLRLSDRALALRLPGAVDALLARHPALSTCFRPLPGTATWQQEVAPPPEWSALRHIDLSALPAAARAEQFSRLAETVQAGLDLAQGRLFAAALFNLGSSEPLRLLLTAHHLVVDGVSWRLILDDLGRLLAGESLPPRPPPPGGPGPWPWSAMAKVPPWPGNCPSGRNWWELSWGLPRELPVPRVLAPRLPPPQPGGPRVKNASPAAVSPPNSPAASWSRPRGPSTATPRISSWPPWPPLQRERSG